MLLSYAFSEKLVYKYLLLTHLHHKRKFHIFCISPTICSGIPHLSFILSIVLASFKTKQTQVSYLSLFCFKGVQIVLNKEADKCKNLLAVIDYGTICACVHTHVRVYKWSNYAYILTRVYMHNYFICIRVHILKGIQWRFAKRMVNLQMYL